MSYCLHELSDVLGATAEPTVVVNDHSTEADVSNVPPAAYDLEVYVTLCFSMAQPSTAIRFEVYFQFDSESCSPIVLQTDVAATKAPRESTWTWLGTAFALEYRVCQLQVPRTADCMRFLIQPADVMDKLVPMSDGCVVTIDRP